jgi:hypothetical protein
VVGLLDFLQREKKEGGQKAVAAAAAATGDMIERAGSAPFFLWLSGRRPDGETIHHREFHQQQAQAAAQHCWANGQ